MSLWKIYFIKNPFHTNFQLPSLFKLKQHIFKFPKKIKMMLKRWHKILNLFGVDVFESHGAVSFDTRCFRGIHKSILKRVGPSGCTDLPQNSIQAVFWSCFFFCNFSRLIFCTYFPNLPGSSFFSYHMIKDQIQVLNNVVWRFSTKKKHCSPHGLEASKFL